MAKKPEGIRIEYTALRTLERWPRNPKRHDEPGIRASVLRHGFVEPIVYDEGTKRIVSGHGRLDVLLELEGEGADPPKRVLRNGKGEWLAPVVRGVSFASEAEAEAFVVAANKLVENGGWDEEKLRPILEGLRTSLGDDVVLTGFSRAELDAMVEAANPKVPVGSATQAPSLTLHFSSEEKRDAVKAKILAAAGDGSKEPTGDVLARVLGAKAKKK